MFDEKLQNFLDRNEACDDVIQRLHAIGVETLEQAWNKSSDEDLIWVVTRDGVMNQEQQRLFLVMVLSSIEDKLTDPRSLNVLTKLRANIPITENDSAQAAKVAWHTLSFKYSTAWAAYAASRAACASWATLDSAKSSWDSAKGASWVISCAAQAKWVRENFNLCNLHTN